jgi:hypothetical protein
MIRELIHFLGTPLLMIFHFIPHFIAFLFMLFVGWLIGMGTEKLLLLLLRKVGFARLSEQIGLTALEQRLGSKMDTTRFLGLIGFWFVFLIFLVPATDALGLPTVSNTLNSVIDYLPNVFVAIVVLILGSLAATLLSNMVQRATQTINLGNPHLLANIIRWGIIGFSGLIALQQLEIAPVLITVLFTAIVGGFALAFGLAFGLGGRDAVQRLLARSESSFLAHQPYDPDQLVQQAHDDLLHEEQMEQHYRDTDPDTDPDPLPSTQMPALSELKKQSLTTPRVDPQV